LSNVAATFAKSLGKYAAFTHTGPLAHTRRGTVGQSQRVRLQSCLQLSFDKCIAHRSSGGSEKDFGKEKKSQEQEQSSTKRINMNEKAGRWTPCRELLAKIRRKIKKRKKDDQGVRSEELEKETQINELHFSFARIFFWRPVSMGRASMAVEKLCILCLFYARGDKESSKPGGSRRQPLIKRVQVAVRWHYA